VPIIRQSLEAALQSQQPADDADDAAAAVTKTTSGDDGDNNRRQYCKRKSVSAMSASGPSSRLNIDCVDYMGRSALHLAVDR
jgi:hypothetical protein